MPTIDELIDRMDRDPRVREAIREHLRRQMGTPDGYVRLADGVLARVGGEDDDGDQ